MAKATQKAPTNGNSKATKPMAKLPTTYVNPKAMAINVGEKAVQAFKMTKDLEQQRLDIVDRVNAVAGQTNAMLTETFFNAAKADPSIKLGDIHAEDERSTKELRQKLEVAVGIKVATVNDDGTVKVEYSPWAKNYFPQYGEKEADEGLWRTKENFRSNFATAFTKCIKAAHACIAKDLQISKDQATGTLLITGKAIKERFNVDSVALNEKREVKDGDKTVKLNKIPSYTELARMSTESVGKTLKTRVDSRAKEVNALNESDVAAAVKSLTIALGKVQDIGDELRTAIEALADACDGALDRVSDKAA